MPSAPRAATRSDEWVDKLQVGDKVLIVHPKQGAAEGTVSGLRKLHIQVDGSLLFRRSGLYCTADTDTWAGGRRLQPYDASVLEAQHEQKRRRAAVYGIHNATAYGPTKFDHLTTEQLEAMAAALKGR